MSTTSDLSNSVRARYLNDYVSGAMSRMVYDQLAYPVTEDREKLQRMSSVVVPFLSDMGLSEQTISETADITPQKLRDATVSLTPTSRADAIQDSEKLLLESYTGYGAARFEKLGENMTASIEAVNMDASLAGNIVNRAIARASLDAGTSGHNFSDAEIFDAGNTLKEMGCPSVVDQDGMAVPDGFVAVMHPDVYYDLLAGGNVVSIATYQDKGIWLQGEVGSINGFRIVASPFAKVFGAAGADNASVAATTLSSASEALDKTIAVASATNLSSGRYLTIGTEETGSAFQHENERVKYVSEAGTTVTLVGRGANGGLKFDHPSGTAVRNADAAYPVLFGGPKSVAKAYASDVGEFGEVVGPNRDGIVEQFVNLGWKWYGGYGIINENWLVRGEYSSSLDA